MSEQQPQSQCPHCGYPIEIGEHAPKCPNRPGTTAEHDEAAEHGRITPEHKDRESARSEAFKKMKRVLTRLTTWGYIAGATILALEATEIAYRETDIIPESIGKPLDEMIYNAGVIQAKALTPTERAKRAELAEGQKKELAELNQRIAEFNEQHKVEFGYLTKVYGKDFVDEYEVTYLEPEISNPERRQETPAEVVVQGFEQVGFAEKELQNIIETTYPKGWVASEVDTVMYVTKPDSAQEAMPAAYGLGGKTAGQAPRKEHGLSSVEIFPSAGQRRDVVQILGHEFSHANDWRTESNVTAGERLELFKAVTQRFFEGGKLYPSTYVQDIKNPDPIQCTDFKVTEYWAEICEQYFSNPKEFKQQYPDDFQLVDEWVKKQDPNFDPVRAAAHRETLLSTVEKIEAAEQAEKIVTEITESLPTDMRAEIDEYIKHPQAELRESAAVDNSDIVTKTYLMLSRTYKKRSDPATFQMSVDQYDLLAKHIVDQISKGETHL